MSSIVLIAVISAAIYGFSMVDGKLVHGTVYHYSMASFGQKFATWEEVPPSPLH